ncbi:conserved hypothetical protein [Gluconacetobacter diazotrophicus PA1 5]|uniref:Uncharacterized protein n=2 Tax=Gluconacetobacter diazotrophicus TaxID=33996 RepID=A9H9E8_GLUDA|nr:DUF2171 domain-containing protein [Gluconacetobacter diazotrophicus]ACI52372.1 conserved hypothetical protein [Gluconacetobacter diazotrophicus PA1 5]MBB2157092.1 DUF2171 domain-containing protein [Gluconacetobacter diazotrophicus]TWB05531.1 hypothetical protein FBZ86_11624 [Gluconacetobacter diazotrophicus]CAP57698.1 conserved hypothetical protein [Gluconacetobacter diazotrophicus PA1 5]
MIASDTIHPGMAVMGSDGVKIGVTDEVEGKTRLKLTSEDGAYHFLPLDEAMRIEGESIILPTPAAKAIADFDRDIPAGEDTT